MEAGAGNEEPETWKQLPTIQLKLSTKVAARKGSCTGKIG